MHHARHPHKESLHDAGGDSEVEQEGRGIRTGYLMAAASGV